MHKSILISSFVFQAPSQPPGNVVWNATDTKVLLNWEQVKAMENESEVTGYKVSCDLDYVSHLCKHTPRKAKWKGNFLNVNDMGFFNLIFHIYQAFPKRAFPQKYLTC